MNSNKQLNANKNQRTRTVKKQKLKRQLINDGLSVTSAGLIFENPPFYSNYAVCVN